MYMYYKNFRSKVCHRNGKIYVGGPVHPILFFVFSVLYIWGPTVSNYKPQKISWL